MKYLAQKIAAISLLLTLSGTNAHAGIAANYNLIWESPGTNYNDSVPLGNGDIGLNAWVESNGDLVFYISKTDSWGDNGRLLKVGKVRIKCAPPLLNDRGIFHQELDLEKGMLRVETKTAWLKSKISLWVDANNPTIEVIIESDAPTIATASIELWRTEPYELPSIELSDTMLDPSKPNKMHTPTLVEPDTLIKGLKNQVGWYHHNIKSVGPSITAKIQGTDGFKREDPLLHRTFGAIISAKNATPLNNQHLRTTRAKKHRFSIQVLTKHPSTPEQWISEIQKSAQFTEKISFEKRKQLHEEWWENFWNRSWIEITESKTNTTHSSDAFILSQAYALQRYVDACAGRGAYPIKFNGSIFTVPCPDKPGDADYRRWGPGYWWQNTRLPYLSMCASGDFEMLEPLFHLYIDQILPLNLYRTKEYFGFNHAAFYSECITFWGDVFLETYGWQPISEREDPLQKSRWHRWEWVAGPELVWMALEAYEYTLDETLLHKRIIPTANAVMQFFDQRYKTNIEGKLVMHPSMACETWWDCTNPMPEIAGLRAITTRLLDLPKNLTSKKDRAYWTSFLKKLPELPAGTREDVRMLLPAQKYENKRNCENPELYAVFPFRLCSFEKENRELGLQALKHRWDRGANGWRQDDIFMAYLGLAEQAREFVTTRAKTHHKDSRFPAFWGPNFDWIPDQDHGGVMMKTVQSMLIQTEGKKIFLLPAWPKNWDCSFKLHAPYRTTVEGIYRNGKFEKLIVTPASREKDLIPNATIQ